MTLTLRVCWPANCIPEVAPKTVVITLEAEPGTAQELRVIIDYWMKAVANFYPAARVEYRSDEQQSLPKLAAVEFDDLHRQTPVKPIREKVTKIRPDQEP
jgi:hypothetical protein